MQVLIVAERSSQSLGEPLRQAFEVAFIECALWEPRLFSAHRDRVAGAARVFFLGNSALADGVRKLAPPGFHVHGASWVLVKRMVALTCEPPVDPSVRTRLDELLNDLSQEVEHKRSLGRDAGLASGAALAWSLLQRRPERHLVRARQATLDEYLREDQLLVALLHFLLNAYDGWAASAVTPVSTGSRVMGPGGPLSGFVDYQASNIRSPTSTPPPALRVAMPPSSTPAPTVRVAAPSGGTPRPHAARTEVPSASPWDPTVASLAELEVPLARARLERADLRARLARGASADRAAGQRELDAVEANLRDLLRRQSELRDQLEHLLTRDTPP